MQRYAKVCRDMQKYAEICKSMRRYVDINPVNLAHTNTHAHQNIDRGG